MKKKIIVSTLVTMAGVTLMVGSAMAIPILTLDAGSGATKVIQDNSVDDTFGTTSGVVGYYGSVGSWDITMSLATSIGAPGLPDMHLTAALTSLGIGGTLTFTFEDTFSSLNADYQGFNSGYGGFTAISGATVNFRTYLDGMEIANLGPNSGGAFSNSSMSAVSPADSSNFTLKIVGEITHGVGAKSSSFDGGVNTGDPSSPVPEPATMLLFGTGLAGLASVSRRKKKFLIMSE